MHEDASGLGGCRDATDKTQPRWAGFKDNPSSKSSISIDNPDAGLAVLWPEHTPPAGLYTYNTE